MFAETPRSRLIWALREGLVLGGIVLAWMVVALVLGLIIGSLRAVFEALSLFRFEILAPILQILFRFDVLGRVIITRIAVANVALYVLVRTGMVIIDHYRNGAL